MRLLGFVFAAVFVWWLIPAWAIAALLVLVFAHQSHRQPTPKRRRR